ncbi:MAG TPA: RNA polymerase-binding protein DksA [Rudaea sp.]
MARGQGRSIMASSKRKPASAAKKKPAAASKAKPAKKVVAAKKPPARPSQKAAKPAPKAVAKPQKSTKKIAPVKTPPAKKQAAPPKPAAKPAKPAVPEKQVSSKASAKPATASASKAGTMAAVKPSTNSNSDTITREDGRYALPSTVNIDLPNGYKPNSKEEYMGPRQLAYFRAKLQKWREDLVEESKQTIDNLRDEVRDVGDEAERATRETENSLELRTRDRYRKLIGKIDKALKRIEEGRYGYCEETDEEIGIERLEARPIATLCLDAQERWEHRQKQMGD